MKIVCVSGYFSPLHSGHIDYLENAKKLGDKLVVILNNNIQYQTRNLHPFIDIEDRLKIVKSIRYVDEVVIAIDENKDISQTLSKLKPAIFAKGIGQASPEEIQVCDEHNIEIINAVGGSQLHLQDLLHNCR